MSFEQQIGTPPSVLNRISPESSALVRRVTAVIIGIWFGGILLVALAAPATFRSVDSVLAAPPESVAKAVKTLGPGLTREILQFQIGEANRTLFAVWGWAQLGFGLTILILLLFMSNVGRPALGLSLAMMALAVLMNFVLIPGIADAGRGMRATLQTGPAGLAGRFRTMHIGFTVFELSVVALGSVLLFLLLRSRRGSGLRRHRNGEI